ncbi:MAG: hypothetical protein NT027_02290, partial [Proteobacteria bacterium]|nr:hypothetical protein [Pseudomonadota bacterium]
AIHTFESILKNINPTPLFINQSNTGSRNLSRGNAKALGFIEMIGGEAAYHFPIQRNHNYLMNPILLANENAFRQHEAKALIKASIDDSYMQVISQTVLLSRLGTGLPSSLFDGSMLLQIPFLAHANNDIDKLLLPLLDQPDAFQLGEKLNSADTLEQDASWHLQLVKKHRDDIFAQKLSDIRNQARQYCISQKSTWKEVSGNQIKIPRNLFKCQNHVSKWQFALSVIESTEDDQFFLQFNIEDKDWSLQLEAQSQVSPIMTKLSIENKSKTESSDKLFFDQIGSQRAVWRFRPSDSHLAWDELGNIVWSGKTSKSQIWTEDYTWHSNGNKKEQIVFNSNGTVKNVQQWFPNGQPMRSLEFTGNGLKNGLETWWFNNGKIAGEIMWDQNKKMGPAKMYFSNGNTAYESYYINDAPDGQLTWRDPSNNIIFQCHFKNGTANGEMMFERPSIRLKTNFVNGLVQNSATVTFTKSGTSFNFNFKDGLLHGDVNILDEKGRIRAKTIFKDGELEGLLSGFTVDLNEFLSASFKSGSMQEWSLDCQKSNKDPDVCSVHGQVLDRREGIARIAISNKENSLKAKCISYGGRWNQCDWTIANKSQSINIDRFTQSSLKAQDKTRCKYFLEHWDLSKLLVQNTPIADAVFAPSVNCQEIGNLRCKIILKNELPVQSCHSSASGKIQEYE